jgi:hypothetical protein
MEVGVSEKETKSSRGKKKKRGRKVQFPNLRGKKSEDVIKFWVR